MYLPLNGTKRKGQIQHSGSVLCTNTTMIADGHTDIKNHMYTERFKESLVITLEPIILDI